MEQGRDGAPCCLGGLGVHIGASCRFHFLMNPYVYMFLFSDNFVKLTVINIIIINRMHKGKIVGKCELTWITNTSGGLWSPVYWVEYQSWRYLKLASDFFTTDNSTSSSSSKLFMLGVRIFNYLLQIFPPKFYALNNFINSKKNILYCISVLVNIRTVSCIR